MGETVLELFCDPPCGSGVCYPCFKSALIPATKLVLFDVGHGDFTLLFNENDLLVVDCGGINSIHRDIQSIANRIQSRCPSTALLISHLHQDHYNFLKYFNNQFFKKIWLPIIPVTRESRRIGEAMLKYLFLSILSDFLDYRILLPPVFDGFKDRVRFLKKSNTFRWAGINWEVLWPDLEDAVFITKVLQKVVPLEKRLKEVDDIAEKYGFHEIFERIAAEITSILEAREEQSARFYRELSDLLMKMEKELETDDEKRRVKAVLQGANEDFRRLVHWLSLVVRSKDNDFLFLGDVEKEALNQINPKRFGPFIAVKASHHGTEFADSLEGLETDFLLISRDGHHLGPINQGYFSVKTKKNLVTKYHGDCILNLLCEQPLSLEVWT